MTRRARPTRDERGAVAVIVAVCAVLIFGATAYAVDLGNAWETRRNMTTGADAAALAAAADYALGDNGCASSAPRYLDENVDEASLEGCNHTAKNADSGYVTVRGGTVATFTFAGIFGIDNQDIHATTTAEYGIPTAVSGLRPFGLCLNGDDDLTAWLNLPSGPNGQSQPITITYSKDQPDACGANAPGNWGVLDFDGGANSNDDTKDWARNGYPGEVSISPPTIPGDTGAFSNSLNSALNFLKGSGDFFALPVFDSVTGSGSNARFNIVAFVSVKLVDFRTTGRQDRRYLTLVFDRGQLSGRCCGNGIDTGVRAVRICDVDTLSPETTDPRAC